MAGNTFGTIFKLSTFGESHGVAMGGIIDGCPAGLEIDLDFIYSEIEKRKTGKSKITSERKEDDKVEFLSGILDGVTTGTPIGFMIRNMDANSADYNHVQHLFRPSHADYTYQSKYGVRDHKGSGRASNRETICRIVGGAIAKLILKKIGVEVMAYTSQIGNLALSNNYQSLDLKNRFSNPVNCPDTLLAQEMEKLLLETKEIGDTLGGIITCVITGMPVGLGEPVFDKLPAELAKAMLSINATKGFEYGSGFNTASMKGSEHNDLFYEQNGKIKTKTNYSGGTQGGISNGEDIYCSVAFKPVSTIMQQQTTLDTNMKSVDYEGKGRHDPCVVPRAVVIVEAMAALVIADQYLRNQCSKIESRN